MNLPIHVINLPARLDRKVNLLGEFKKHNIEGYNFANTVCGKDIDIEEMKSKGLLVGKFTPGQCGCYLSHLNVFKSILESPIEIHLVLEDDIYFVDKFNSRIEELIRKVEKFPWDIFYVGINCCDAKCREGVYIGDKKDGIYYPKNDAWGTHGYLIKKSSIEEIMKSAFPMMLPFDVFLARLSIKRLTLIRTLVKTYNEDSDTI